MTYHKLSTVKAYPWPQIELHYANLNKHGWGHERLLELVMYINTTDLRDRLYAFTSLDTLVVSNCNPIYIKSDALYIEFDRQKQCWHFRYYSQPYKMPEFERQYAADRGIEKLEKFVSMIRW